MIENDFWKEKRVLITGGTLGLGKALALNLLSLNSKIAVVARHKDEIEKLTKDSSIIGIQADISNKEDIHRISGQMLGQLGGIDVLFNNASSLGVTPLQSLVDSECEDIEEVFQTNLLGPFRLTKALLPTMLLNTGGLVVNVSSDAAVSAYPNWGGYSISKAALDHLSRIWNEELKSEKIQFLSIDPGDMNTALHLAAIPDADTSKLYQPKDVAKDLLNFLSKGYFRKIRYSADEWRALL